jgi:hypothetical protein
VYRHLNCAGDNQRQMFCVLEIKNIKFHKMEDDYIEFLDKVVTNNKKLCICGNFNF